MYEGTSPEDLCLGFLLSVQTAKPRIAALRASILATCCLTVDDTIEVQRSSHQTMPNIHLYEGSHVLVGTVWGLAMVTGPIEEKMVLDK